MTRPLRASAASLAVVGLALVAAPTAAADEPATDAVLTVSTEVVGVDDVDGDGSTGRGDVVTYRFVVANTGTEDLDEVGLVDARSSTGARTACGDGSLAGGASTDCTLTYVLTLADEARGYVDSRVRAVAVADDGTEVTSAESTTRQQTSGPDARIQLRTTAGPIDDLDRDGPGVDDTIDYTFEITNVGNVVLQQLAVRAPDGLEATCAPAPLAPDGVATCTATHAITLTEAAAGLVSTAVTASARSAEGLTAYASTTTTTGVVRSPKLSIDTTSESSAAGVIDYTIAVTNTGNVPFDPVRVSLGLVQDVTCDRDALDPTEEMTCTASYDVTDEDRVAGGVTDRATAAGTGPGGGVIGAVGSVTTAVQPVTGPAPTGAPTDATPDGSTGGSTDGATVEPSSGEEATASPAPSGQETTGASPTDPSYPADPAAPQASGPGDAVIPDTSGPSRWVLAAGAGLVAAGLALLVRSRRTRRG